MTEITHRFIETNGIRMHIAEAGQGPLVVLLHGFPECWYTWSHQLAALAEAGYHVVAPDQRGYGQTGSAGDGVEKYTRLHLTGDIVGLLETLGERQTVVVGHDWGAVVAWDLAMMRPDRVRGVMALKFPYWPRMEGDIAMVSPPRTVDVISQLAEPLPVTIMAELLGLPEHHRADYPRWSETLFDAMGPVREDWPTSMNGVKNNAKEWVVSL